MLSFYQPEPLAAPLTHRSLHEIEGDEATGGNRPVKNRPMNRCPLSSKRQQKNRHYKIEFHFRISGFVNLRTSEIHSFYNLLFFYWHFVEILWLFIFQILYYRSVNRRYKERFEIR
jgi:hypothetical protein